MIPDEKIAEYASRDYQESLTFLMFGNKRLAPFIKEEIRSEREAEKLNPPGWPRPTVKLEEEYREKFGHKTLPVPYSSGNGMFVKDWARVSRPRSHEIAENNLCVVCGEHRGNDWVWALLFGEPKNIAKPSPTYGHPRCILLACMFCPHLKNQRYPAMLQDGRKITVDELRNHLREKA